jgi:hypothetical protein
VEFYKGVKGFGSGIANQLYDLKIFQYDNFIDLLVDMEEKSILCSKIEDLIKIQYFVGIGNNGKLLTIYKEFTEGKNRYQKNTYRQN